MYDTFDDVFQRQFVIPLDFFRLECDEGSRFAKFAKLQGFEPCFCLLHFLASLPDRVFRAFVHYLVIARTRWEFDCLRIAYREQLHMAIRSFPVTGFARRREFRKAGLSMIYQEGEEWSSIIISVPER
jgi:hypothetical protein